MLGPEFGPVASLWTQLWTENFSRGRRIFWL